MESYKDVEESTVIALYLCYLEGCGDVSLKEMVGKILAKEHQVWWAETVQPSALNGESDSVDYLGERQNLKAMRRRFEVTKEYASSLDLMSDPYKNEKQ